MAPSEMSDLDVRAALLAAARAELAECGHAAISLRAVARRAGVSHAAPKYYFADRAALLTAVATEGFNELAAALRSVRASLAAFGQAYIDFGLANRALFDLMFRPNELHAGDPELLRAQRAAIGTLNSVVAIAEGQTEPVGAASPELTLICWALVHGLVVLTRDGALQSGAGRSHRSGPDLAHDLAAAFTAIVTDQ